MLSMKKNSTAAPNLPIAGNPSDFDVIIGCNSAIDGHIRSGGSVRIDGKVTGDIRAEGEVIIGHTAECTGNVVARNIEISGQVTGNVTSGGSLKIYSTGLLKGDIEVTSFVIDEGGVFEGLCYINTKGLPAEAGNGSPQESTETSSIT